MKRVCVITELYYPEQNATGHFLTGIAEGLSEDAFSVTVLCGQPTYNQRGVTAPIKEKRKGVEIRRCRATTFDSKNIAGRLLNFITISWSITWQSLFRIRHMDKVLVVTNPPLLPFLIRIVCKLKRAKFFLLVHDVYPDVLIPLDILKKSSFIYKSVSLLNRWLYNSAGKIIVLGRDMRDLVMEKAPNIEANKVVIIPNWADVEKITQLPKKSCALVKKHSLENSFIVQYSGNHGRTHDLLSLVKAAEKLKMYKDIVFLFIGDGSGKKALVEYVQKNQVPNIIFEDYVLQEELSQALNASDLFIISFKKGMAGISVPSRMYNLMATARPILASVGKDSEVAQVVMEELIGLIVEPCSPQKLAEQILAFKQDKEMAKTMGARARQCSIEKYSYSVIKEKYRLLFSED